MARKAPLSELAAPLKIYPQVLENVRVADKAAAQNDPDVQAAVEQVAAALGDTGRILVARIRHRAGPARDGGGPRPRAVRKARGGRRGRHPRKGPRGGVSLPAKGSVSP